MTGLELRFEEEDYSICGVFDQGSSVLLLAGEEGFTAAELFPVPEGTDLYRYAQSCAAQAGLEAPTQILCGPEVALLAGLLPWLGALMTALPLVRRITRQRSWIWLLILPFLLPLLPDWWIPTRWSDTVFWAELAQSLHLRFQDWLTLRPSLRDLAVKESWYGLAVGLLALVNGIIPSYRLQNVRK